MTLMIKFCSSIHEKTVNTKRNLYFASGKDIPLCLYSFVHNCMEVGGRGGHQIAFFKNFLKNY